MHGQLEFIAIANHPRNVPDEVLKLTAKNGGVVMVNFYPTFIVPASAERGKARTEFKNRLEAEGKTEDEVNREVARWENEHPIQRGTIHDVVDHIEHIIQVAGVNHVGIGSDYDGVDSLPVQLEDVSTYPLITQELLNRGYSESDIRKIMGQNILRVLRQAEKVAANLKAQD